MNCMVALLCLVIGIAWLSSYKKVSKIYAEFMARRFKELYSGYATKMKWDDPKTWQSISYKLGIIGVGFCFFALAFYFVFGTIHL
jgi:hypothetical protein